ncbi:MAG TPA: ROK family protein [Verrucomicrobiae bacterium]|nr:ROK family protein [Verrucomicrobiae bacterium]
MVARHLDPANNTILFKEELEVLDNDGKPIPLGSDNGVEKGNKRRTVYIIQSIAPFLKMKMDLGVAEDFNLSDAALAELKGMNKIAETLIESLAQANARKAEIETTLIRLKAERVEAEDDIAQTRGDLQANQERVAMLTLEIDRLENENEALRTEINGYQTLRADNQRRMDEIWGGGHYPFGVRETNIEHTLRYTEANHRAVEKLRAEEQTLMAARAKEMKTHALMASDAARLEKALGALPQPLRGEVEAKVKASKQQPLPAEITQMPDSPAKDLQTLDFQAGVLRDLLAPITDAQLTDELKTWVVFSEKIKAFKDIITRRHKQMAVYMDRPFAYWMLQSAKAHKQESGKRVVVFGIYGGAGTGKTTATGILRDELARGFLDKGWYPNSGAANRIWVPLNKRVNYMGSDPHLKPGADLRYVKTAAGRYSIISGPPIYNDKEMERILRGIIEGAEVLAPADSDAPYSPAGSTFDEMAKTGRRVIIGSVLEILVMDKTVFGLSPSIEPMVDEVVPVVFENDQDRLRRRYFRDAMPKWAGGARADTENFVAGDFAQKQILEGLWYMLPMVMKRAERGSVSVWYHDTNKLMTARPKGSPRPELRSPAPAAAPTAIRQIADRARQEILFAASSKLEVQASEKERRRLASRGLAHAVADYADVFMNRRPEGTMNRLTRETLAVPGNFPGIALSKNPAARADAYLPFGSTAEVTQRFLKAAADAEELAAFTASAGSTVSDLESLASLAIEIMLEPKDATWDDDIHADAARELKGIAEAALALQSLLLNLYSRPEFAANETAREAWLALIARLAALAPQLSAALHQGIVKERKDLYFDVTRKFMRDAEGLEALEKRAWDLRESADAAFDSLALMSTRGLPLLNGFIQKGLLKDGKLEAAQRAVENLEQNLKSVTSSRAELRTVSRPGITPEIAAYLASPFNLMKRGENGGVILEGKDIAEAGDLFAAEWLRAIQERLKTIPAQEKVISHVATGNTPWIAYTKAAEILKNWNSAEAQAWLTKYGLDTTAKPDMARVIVHPLDALFPQKRTDYHAFANILNNMFERLGIPQENRRLFYGDVADSTGKAMSDADYAKLMQSIQKNGLKIDEFLKLKTSGADAAAYKSEFDAFPEQLAFLEAFYAYSRAMADEIKAQGGAHIFISGVGPNYEGKGHIGFMEGGTPFDQGLLMGLVGFHMASDHMKEDGGMAKLWSDAGTKKYGFVTYGFDELLKRPDVKVLGIATGIQKAEALRRGIETAPSVEYPISRLQKENVVWVVDKFAARNLRYKTNFWDFQELKQADWTEARIAKLFTTLSLQVKKPVAELTPEDLFKSEGGQNAPIMSVRRANYATLLQGTAGASNTEKWNKLRDGVAERIRANRITSAELSQRLGLKPRSHITFMNPHLDDDILAMHTQIAQLTREGHQVSVWYTAPGYTAVHSTYAYHVLDMIAGSTDLLNDLEYLASTARDEGAFARLEADLLQRLIRSLKGTNINAPLAAHDYDVWNLESADEQFYRARLLLLRLFHQKPALAAKLQTTEQFRAFVAALRAYDAGRPGWGSEDLDVMKDIKVILRFAEAQSSLMEAGVRYENIHYPMNATWYGTTRSGTVKEQDVEDVVAALRHDNPDLVILPNEEFGDMGAHDSTKRETFKAIMKLKAEGKTVKALGYRGVWDRTPATGLANQVSILHTADELNAMDFAFEAHFRTQSRGRQPVPDSGFEEPMSFSKQVLMNARLTRDESVALGGPLDASVEGVLNFNYYLNFDDAAVQAEISGMLEELDAVRPSVERASATAVNGPVPYGKLSFANVARPLARVGLDVADVLTWKEIQRTGLLNEAIGGFRDLEAWEKHYETLAAQAAQGQAVEIKIYLRDAAGIVHEEVITMPKDALELTALNLAERVGLAARIASLINIYGLIVGATEVAVGVSDETVIPARTLLGWAKGLLPVAFGISETMASFGKGITWNFDAPKLESAAAVEEKAKVAVDYNKGEALGFDVGGTNLKVAYKKDGKVMWFDEIPLEKMPRTPQGRIDLGGFIQDYIVRMEHTYGTTLRDKPIYVIVPGPVNPEGGIVAMVNLETQWPGTLASFERLKAAVPTVKFQNDANASIFHQIAELGLTGNVIGDTLGTGIGGAVAINGKLLPGPMETHVRNYFGANAVFHEGFGMPGDIESYSNASGIVRRAAQLYGEKGLTAPSSLTPAMLALRLEPSNPDVVLGEIAVQTFHEAGANLTAWYRQVARVTGIKEWDVIHVGGIAQGRTIDKIQEGAQTAAEAAGLTIRQHVGKESPRSGAIAAANFSLQDQQLAAAPKSELRVNEEETVVIVTRVPANVKFGVFLDQTVRGLLAAEGHAGVNPREFADVVFYRDAVPGSPMILGKQFLNDALPAGELTITYKVKPQAQAVDHELDTVAQTAFANTRLIRRLVTEVLANSQRRVLAREGQNITPSFHAGDLLFLKTAVAGHSPLVRYVGTEKRDVTYVTESNATVTENRTVVLVQSVFKEGETFAIPMTTLGKTKGFAARVQESTVELIVPNSRIAAAIPAVLKAAGTAVANAGVREIEQKKVWIRLRQNTQGELQLHVSQPDETFTMPERTDVEVPFADELNPLKAVAYNAATSAGVLAEVLKPGTVLKKPLVASADGLNTELAPGAVLHFEKPLGNVPTLVTFVAVDTKPVKVAADRTENKLGIIVKSLFNDGKQYFLPFANLVKAQGLEHVVKIQPQYGQEIEVQLSSGGADLTVADHPEIAELLRVLSWEMPADAMQRLNVLTPANDKGGYGPQIAVLFKKARQRMEVKVQAVTQQQRQDVTVYTLTDTKTGSSFEIVPAFGNKVISFQTRVNGDDREVLYQPQDLTWDGGIPVLWPFANRIQNGKFTWNGAEHELGGVPGMKVLPTGHAIHGMIESADWIVEKSGEDAEGVFITATLDTALYPYIMEHFGDAKLTMTYRLKGAHLSVETTIQNKGAAPIPMTFAFHPWFRISEDRSLVSIQMPAAARWAADEGLIPLRQAPATVEGDEHFDLRAGKVIGGERYDDVFTGLVPDAEGQVVTTLTDTGKDHVIQIAQSAEFANTVFYTPGDKPTVAIEPQTGSTDAINMHNAGIAQAHLTELAPGDTFTGTVSYTAAAIAPKAELREAPSALRLPNEDFRRWQEAFRVAKPYLKDYDNRRWVSVHVAQGVYAIIPSDLEPQIREALVEFLQHDLFYFDYPVSKRMGTDGAAAPSRVTDASSLTGLDISVIEGIDDSEKHFLGVAEALSQQPHGYVQEFMLYDSPEEGERMTQEAARLSREFNDEYHYAGFAGRYRLEAVSRKELASRIRGSIADVYNEARGAGKLASLEEFTRHNVTFSSTNRSLLARSLANIGWLIHKDYQSRRPAYEAIRRERSMRLAAGLLDAELIRKLDEAKSVRVILSAVQELMPDVDLVAVQLWEAEAAQRWFHRSA